MNILVTGANGQLGNSLRDVSRNSGDHYIFTDVNSLPELETRFLDITDINAIRGLVKEEQVECIINCAAYTNVEAAEKDVQTAELLNVTAVDNLAKAMREMDGLLVHISTDYVFGGEPYNTPCTEAMKGTPTGVYGRTKLEGENRILASGVKYVIFRTSWLYSEYGKNFCKTMLSLTATKDELKVVFDQTGTPTYAHDLAQAIYEVLENRRFEGRGGIFNYSNEGVCSWYDFARAIAEYSGHDRCKVLPCHTDEFPSSVRRPAYSVLDKSKFKSVFEMDIPHWTESLHKCIKNIGL